MIPVPIAYLDKRLELVGSPKCGDDLRIGTIGNVNHIAAKRENSAAALLIILAGAAVLAINVSLRAAQFPTTATGFNTAICTLVYWIQVSSDSRGDS